MGVPHEVINEEGDRLWSASYGATGEVTQIDASRLSIPIRFQGQYYDYELTISYNRHRYFDAQIASFLSQDPIGLAGGGNPYRYGPNVWSWSDPLGLSCMRTWFQRYTAAGRLPRFLKQISQLRGTATSHCRLRGEPSTTRCLDTY